MIKLILFDLDGVITDTKEIHYRTLNDAIAEVDTKYVITEHEHVTKYDGLKTITKLSILTKEKGLPQDLHKQIYDKKQKLTLEEFAHIIPDESILSIFKKLKDDGYLLGCCTNCIRRTALVALAKTGVIEYLDVIITNDDVKNEYFTYYLTDLNKLRQKQHATLQDIEYNVLINTNKDENKQILYSLS